MSLGWTPEPHRATDRSFSELRLGTSSTGDDYTIPSPLHIMRQGHGDTCVAQAVCEALEIRTQSAPLSRLFVYYGARRRRGFENEDRGCFIRDAMDCVGTNGVCAESFWEYDLQRVNERPPLQAFERAWDHKITGYYRIDFAGRADQIEQAVRADHPVVGGFMIGQPFVDYRGSDVVFHPPGHPIGGHAMVIDGVRRIGGARHFRLRNSWGHEWGAGGFAWAAEDWIADWTSEDFWVLTAG